MKEPNHNSPDSKSDGDQPLWDLLGNASKIEVNPMFSRNVIRSIRLSESEEPSGMLGWFRRPVFLVCSAAVAIALFAGALVVNKQTGPVESLAFEEASEFDPAEEIQSIEMLGELMAVSDPGTLSDEALINLLF